ncbi:hypothetical protein GQ54DRAFT_299466 [Martensiomyces pterosporus]|nr:hypothetical protein GQ54DRAFT_299466 [Martensiomyces pterosporus]
MSTLRHGQLNNVRLKSQHQWTQKQLRVLFNNIHSEYLEKSVPIDWKRVGQRVQVDSSSCQTKFYALQRELKDQATPRNPIWSRSEIEKVIRCAREVQKESLREGRTEIDWAKVSKLSSERRTPQECKRIFDNYYYLCRVNVSMSSSTTKMLGLVGVFGLVCIFGLGEPLVASLL